MTQTVPTVDEVLAETAIGGGFHEWNDETSLISVTRDELRKALEDAYDPSMPFWPALVEIECSYQDN